MRLDPLLLILLAGTALAQSPPSKPGLWEMKTLSLEVDGKPMPTPGQMPPEMAQMPPEVRKMMQERMKAQGIDLANGGIRMCFSAESMKESAWGSPQGQNDCKTEVVERSGSTWRWKVQCKEGHGEGRTTFSGGEGYRSDMQFTSTGKGQAQTMKTQVQARWLGADCGGLKPIQPPAPTKGK
ncbi:MAG: DUF3617 domain-containing protein [Inhella sp.]